MSSRLIQILVSIFSVWLFTNIGFATEAVPDSSPSWVSHVSSPGPDNPASGVSLFDQLFLKNNQGKKEYAIPYPLEALLADLEKRIDNGKQASVPQALIPIGRSLQREAAAPDYFHFPKSVITLVGEPVIASGQSASVLNYRLFIGYQEKAKQNANRISEMTLSWPQNSVNGGPPQSLQMELVVSYDYKVLQDAIEQMVSEAMTGRSQALTSKPFRQQAIIADLEKHLGMEALKWCCEFEKPV